MQIINQWLSFEHAAHVAEAVCADIMLHAQVAITERDSFKLVLAGGSTPEQVYRLLAQQKTDWSKWFIYYGDERCLAADHPQRNSVMAQQALLNHVDIPKENIFTIPAELGMTSAAVFYEHTIADILPFDMVLLGMGEDGHTASLFPGQHYADEALVHTVTNSPKPPPERVTLSAIALSNTRRLLFMIIGAEKQEAIRQWKMGYNLPVSTIQPNAGIDIYLDNAALG